jgi:hypothetical protein
MGITSFLRGHRRRVRGGLLGVVEFTHAFVAQPADRIGPHLAASLGH